jgi:hypothetical protein
MRHNPTDPGQDTVRTRNNEEWNADRDGRRLQSDADIADDVEQRDRIGRAGSEPGVTSGVTGGAWQDIKSRFVDDPKGAIAAAEQLVQQALEARVRALQEEAAAVCTRDREVEDDASTEALRTRLIRYQQYCERLGDSSVH